MVFECGEQGSVCGGKTWVGKCLGCRDEHLAPAFLLSVPRRMVPGVDDLRVRASRDYCVLRAARIGSEVGGWQRGGGMQTAISSVICIFLSPVFQDKHGHDLTATISVAQTAKLRRRRRRCRHRYQKRDVAQRMQPTTCNWNEGATVTTTTTLTTKTPAEDTGKKQDRCTHQ